MVILFQTHTTSFVGKTKTLNSFCSLFIQATAYRPLMIKMIEILSELPHRFILSKGVIGHEYDSIMGDNMAGENFIDQLSVLQSVSMIISHGGVSLWCPALEFLTESEV